MLPIECEIQSLKLVTKLLPNTSIEEEHFLYLTKMDETHDDAYLINDTYKKHIKTHYDKFVWLRIFAEGDLVLVYDQDHDKIGAGKLEPMWNGPYIIKCVLQRGAYELDYYDGIHLNEPHNGLYMRKYYA